MVYEGLPIHQVILHVQFSPDLLVEILRLHDPNVRVDECRVQTHRAQVTRRAPVVVFAGKTPHSFDLDSKNTTTRHDVGVQVATFSRLSLLFRKE